MNGAWPIGRTSRRARTTASASSANALPEPMAATALPSRRRVAALRPARPASKHQRRRSQQRERVDATRGQPRASGRRELAPASRTPCADRGARKSTHARDTLRCRSSPPGRGAWRPSSACWILSFAQAGVPFEHEQRAVQPPHTTKVHAAPCQSPPSSIVSSRLRSVAHAAAAAAAERDVQVVAQPGREARCASGARTRAMRSREVGQAKFACSAKPRSARQPRRHVGVAGEVAVDLDGEGAATPIQRVGPRIGPRGSANTASTTGAGVGDHHLLEQAPER